MMDCILPSWSPSAGSVHRHRVHTACVCAQVERVARKAGGDMSSQAWIFRRESCVPSGIWLISDKAFKVIFICRDQARC